MFRVAVLSIVLTVAGGQNVALLCGAWCGPHAAAARECHHENSSTTPSVAGDEHCGSVVVGATAVLREEMRRDVSSKEANHAIPVPRYQLAQLTIGSRPGQNHWRERSLEERPLVIALRI